MIGNYSKMLMDQYGQSDTMNTISKFLLGAGRGMAQGVGRQAFANALAGGSASAEQAMDQAQARKDKQLQAIMSLGLSGAQLNTELAKLGVTQQHYNDWKNVYLAKAASSGAAGQRVGPIDNTTGLALKDKYTTLMQNPKSDKVFFNGLPTRVRDQLNTSEGSKSYNAGLMEAQRIAKENWANDIAYLKQLGGRSPTSITTSQAELEP